MGKSPGKWIKAKLFGKKSTKSTVSARGNGGKEAFIVSKVSSGIVASNDPVISSPQLVSVYKNGQKVESGDRRDVMPPQESNTFVSGSQDAGVKSTGSTPEDESDVLKKEQAAAKVQAALRGFLARRAFRALKGIIRLQALMRGHLVRRQAHATLHCLQGIIKVQALVRGQKVRLSEAGIEVKHKCNLEKLKLDTVGALKSIFPEKLPKNMYARKLLASSSKAKPLALHYDSCDVNSAWKWLERWSLSYFWELVVEPKRDTGSKTFSKSGSSRGGEMKNGRPKRSNLKNSAIHDNSSEYGNPRGTLKKYTTRQANGHNDLDKVKPNPRKISSTKSDSDKKPEGAFDKPKSKTPKMCIRENLLVVPVQGSSKSVEKHQDSTDLISIKKPSESAKTLMAVEDIGLFDAIAKESELTIDVSLVVEKLENSGLQQSILTDHENSPVVVEEVHSKEDSSIKDKENLKTRRRKSLSAKHDYSENESQNSQTLPSYMQATKSAKAKLKAQVSPRLSQEYSENGVVRRHSLPSSTGEKLITPSPRIQKLVQARSKGDKSLSASKDYNNNDSVGGLMFMKTSMSFSEVNHHHHGFDEEEGLVNQEDEFSEDYGGGSSLSGEKKKRLKREQVRELERSFELGNKLDSARKQQLAKSLGLLKKQFASTMADNDNLGSFHYEVYLSVACTDFLLHSMNLFPSLSRPATGPHFLETSLRSNPNHRESTKIFHKTTAYAIFYVE